MTKRGAKATPNLPGDIDSHSIGMIRHAATVHRVKAE